MERTTVWWEAGKNASADVKLRGWWDSLSGCSCVTALHKGLRRQRGSGSEVISVESHQSCLRTQRGRAADYSNNMHFIHPYTRNRAFKAACC